MKNKLQFFILLIIALLAGITGGLITKNYFLKDFYNLVFNSEVNLSNYNKASLIITDAKKVVVNQDVKADETATSAKESLWGIFKKIKPETKGDFLKNNYRLDQPLAQGLALSNDGWLMVLGLSDNPDKKWLNDYVAINRGGEVYDLATGIYDAKDGLWFIRLAEAKNLPLKNLVKKNEILNGQLVLAVSSSGYNLLNSLVYFGAGTNSRSSDDSFNRLVLASQLPDSLKNSFIFNLNGEVVAFSKSGELRLINDLRNEVYGIFKDKALSYPTLGVNYLDLSQITSSTKTTIRTKGGALLYGPNAVVKGSAAEKAGLKAGDIITYFDGVEINSTNDLADIMEDYLPGDKIILKIIRADKIEDKEIVLGSGK